MIVDKQKWNDICSMIPQPTTNKTGWWRTVKFAFTLACLGLYDDK